MRFEQKMLADRINDLCRQYGFTYYTLSYKSGVPLSTLMHIVDGTVKNPGIFTIVRICNGIGITMSEFFDTESFRSMLEKGFMEE